jgi:hypothetical protein
VLNVRRLSLTCSFLAVASAAAQVPTEVRSAAGCYSLTMTPWSPIVGSDSAYYRVPSAIRLDTVRSTLELGWVLSPNIAYPHGQSMPPAWRLVADTMRLVWSNGVAPTLVTLVRADSAWTGEAIAESDDHPIAEQLRPRARVTVRRRVCATAPQ